MNISLIDHMPFARELGIDLTATGKDRVAGSLTVHERLCTTGRIMHGGAIMAVADTLGALGAYQNLPEGAKATTTIESKTNFLGAAPLDAELDAETTPLHLGKRTSVWQTRLTCKGKLVAIVTQTQLVLY